MNIEYKMRLDDGRYFYVGTAEWVLDDGRRLKVYASILAKTTEEAMEIWKAVLATEHPSVDQATIRSGVAPYHVAVKAAIQAVPDVVD